MSVAPDIELPLYKAFMELVQLERSLPQRGVDAGSYLVLIDTLRKGYMLASREELVFFCKKLWLKPFHQNNPIVNEKVLEDILERNLAEYAGIVASERGTGTAGTAGPKPDAPSSEKDGAGKGQARDETPAKQQEQPESPAVNGSGQMALTMNIEEGEAENSLEKADHQQLFNNRKFEFNYRYLPVGRRFIEQTIRSLRYKLEGAGKPAIDIQATVKELVTSGHINGWRMQEQDDLVTRWTLLLDRDGSMIAFHAFEDALVEAAFRGTMKNHGDVFYFRNVAVDYLYTNVHRSRSVDIDEVVRGPRRNILIVSDAGAGRGNYSRGRIGATIAMLSELRQHRIAWLNPLPKERWEGSSAAAIARVVNMFQPGDDNSDELGNIVRLFKSKILTDKL